MGTLSKTHYYFHQDFQEQLKVKEPATYQSLLDESVIIQVPSRPTCTKNNSAPGEELNSHQTVDQPEKEEIVMRNQGFI